MWQDTLWISFYSACLFSDPRYTKNQNSLSIQKETNRFEKLPLKIHLAIAHTASTPHATLTTPRASAHHVTTRIYQTTLPQILTTTHHTHLTHHTHPHTTPHTFTAPHHTTHIYHTTCNPGPEVYAYIWKYKHAQTHTHTLTHAHIHAHTHIHTHISQYLWPGWLLERGVCERATESGSVGCGVEWRGCIFE